MAQGSLLPHEDTRSQLGKFNFTKPLMFHKALESKSGAATEKRVTRPLCRTWRRHPVGSSGPRFTPPPPPRCPPAAEDKSAARTGLIHRRTSLQGRSTGQRGGGDAHAEHTETSETHNSQHVPPLAALSLQPPMPHRPSPRNPCRFLRPPEISISQPSNTSPASRPHRPNSQLQTNRAYLI